MSTQNLYDAPINERISHRWSLDMSARVDHPNHSEVRGVGQAKKYRRPEDTEQCDRERYLPLHSCLATINA